MSYYRKAIITLEGGWEKPFFKWDENPLEKVTAWLMDNQKALTIKLVDNDILYVEANYLQTDDLCEWLQKHYRDSFDMYELEEQQFVFNRVKPTKKPT